MNLRADNLCFRYGEHSVLEHIQLEMHEGEFLFLLGANGAGKTTLLKLLAGLLATVTPLSFRMSMSQSFTHTQ